MEIIFRFERTLKNSIENIIMNSCERGRVPFYFGAIILYLRFRWRFFCWGCNTKKYTI